MKIVVTGGNGFIGRYVVKLILQAGHTPVVYDDLSNSAFDDTLPCQFVIGDILDTGKLKGVVHGAEAVIHLAARVSVEESHRRPCDFISSNVVGTASVLESAPHGLPCRIVLASTGAVYGDRKRLAVSEGAIRCPQSIYAVSKCAAEDVLEIGANGKNISTSILRFFNVYGDGQSPSSPYSGVITRWLELLGMAKDLRINGSGSQVRDFIHVSDVARAVVDLGLFGAPGVYNVGTGVGTSIATLADMMSTGTRSKTVLSGIEIPGDIEWSQADISAAIEEGWAPRMSLNNWIESKKVELNFLLS